MRSIIQKDVGMGEPFVEWLIADVRRYIALHTDFDLLSSINLKIGKVNIDCVEAMLEILDSIVFYEQGDTFVIQIDPTATYKGTEVMLNSVARVLEYGNSDFKGQGVISHIFNDVSRYINHYFKKYRIMRGAG